MSDKAAEAVLMDVCYALYFLEAFGDRDTEQAVSALEHARDQLQGSGCQNVVSGPVDDPFA